MERGGGTDHTYIIRKIKRRGVDIPKMKVEIEKRDNNSSGLGIDPCIAAPYTPDYNYSYIKNIRMILEGIFVKQDSVLGRVVLSI